MQNTPVNHETDLLFHFSKIRVPLHQLLSELTELVKLVLVSPDVVAKVLVTLQKVFRRGDVPGRFVGVQGILYVAYPVDEALWMR